MQMQINPAVADAVARDRARQAIALAERERRASATMGRHRAWRVAPFAAVLTWLVGR